MHNIGYECDQERWGGDYWQTPEETLFYGTGDCEDFSILLCSFLRAYGIDAEQVYVSIGVDGGEQGHAFLIEDWYHDGASSTIAKITTALSHIVRLLSRFTEYLLALLFN